MSASSVGYIKNSQPLGQVITSGQSDLVVLTNDVSVPNPLLDYYISGAGIYLISVQINLVTPANPCTINSFNTTISYNDGSSSGVTEPIQSETILNVVMGADIVQTNTFWINSTSNTFFTVAFLPFFTGDQPAFSYTVNWTKIV